MIRELQLGEKHSNIKEVIFENGDIMMTRVQYDPSTFSLVFNQQEPHKIGETHNEYAGKSIDEFPSEIKVCFSFKNPKSITAVIHSLIELQKDMFDGKLNISEQKENEKQDYKEDHRGNT